MNALDSPAVGQEFGQLLEHDTRIPNRAQQTTTIDREPNADVHRVAGLAQQHCIVLYRVCDGFPALPLGVVAERGNHGSQVVGVNRDVWEVSRPKRSRWIASKRPQQSNASGPRAPACQGSPI